MKTFDIPKLNMKIHYGVTKEGLAYYLIPNKDLNVFYATINVEYGAEVEEYKIDNEIKKIIPGTAHFLEHLIFNKKDYKTFDEYSKIGISANACTSYSNTFYEIYGSSNFNRGLELLLNTVFVPYFTEELTENEKGIIIEEESSAHSNPYFQFSIDSKKNIYHQKTYNNRVCGEVKEIKKIKCENIEDVYKAFYHPKNTFLIISGNFNVNEANTLINETMSKYDIKEQPKVKIKHFKEPKKVVKEKGEMYLDIQYPKLKLSYKFDRKLFKKYAYNELYFHLSAILEANFGATSDLKQELLDKNMIIGSIFFNYTILDDVIVIKFILETECPKETYKIIDEVFNNLKVFPKDLLLFKRRKIKSYILSSDNAVSFHDCYQKMLFTSKKRTLYDFYDNINNVNMNNINDFIRNLKNYSKATFIVYPKK